jgi:hypothetical protein
LRETFLGYLYEIQGIQRNGKVMHGLSYIAANKFVQEINKTRNIAIAISNAYTRHSSDLFSLA